LGVYDWIGAAVLGRAALKCSVFIEQLASAAVRPDRLVRVSTSVSGMGALLEQRSA
jgi:hypothetical protein